MTTMLPGVYAASFGMALSTKRKNRMLRAPATDRHPGHRQSPPARVVLVAREGFELTHGNRRYSRIGDPDRTLCSYHEYLHGGGLLTVAANQAKKHHYVPRFYLRCFACADDENKIMVLERHRDFVVADRKSIDGIGYEERLHDYDDNGAPASIEGDLNKAIETPFSQSMTWLKICRGNCAGLDESDRLPLYGFARHLQLRNLETLRFIKTQHARYLTGELEDELTEEERDMHAWIASDPGAAHELFRAGAMETMLPADASAINVIVCQTPIALRSSTNPAIRLSNPGNDSIFGTMFNSLRIWWLALDRHWGAFFVAGGPSGFSSGAAPLDLARVVNRRYLVQLLEGGARYMLADDDFLGEDLEWAAFTLAQRTSRGFRYRKITSAS